MNVEYCTSCGYKNVYTVKAPSFCGGCGESLDKKSATPKKKSSLARTRIPEQVIEEEEGTETIPDISRLEYTVDAGFENKKLTIRDLVQEGPSEGGPLKRSAAKRKSMSKEDILKEGLQSCKSARTQPPEEIE